MTKIGNFILHRLKTENAVVLKYKNLYFMATNFTYRILIFFASFYLLCCSAMAQQQVPTDSNSNWAFSASGYYYFIPEDKNTFTFIGTADYKKLHLETRYNYEDQNTGSVFAGWKFKTKGKVQFEAVPMMGIVFGNTNGIAPGLELSLTYNKFDYYSETEYVIDFADQENNFLYTWGEIAFSPIEALRTGISYQRTRLYQTSFDTQRGIFAEYSFWKLTAGIFYFNPFSSNELVTATLTFDF